MRRARKWAMSIERLFHWGRFRRQSRRGRFRKRPCAGWSPPSTSRWASSASACPDAAPLLAFVSLVAPAIARGNTLVCIPSPPYPLSATDLYQVFDTSDLPAGVVNIITGERGLPGEDAGRA